MNKDTRKSVSFIKKERPSVRINSFQCVHHILDIILQRLIVYIKEITFFGKPFHPTPGMRKSTSIKKFFFCHKLKNKEAFSFLPKASCCFYCLLLVFSQRFHQPLPGAFEVLQLPFQQQFWLSPFQTLVQHLHLC